MCVYNIAVGVTDAIISHRCTSGVCIILSSVSDGRVYEHRLLCALSYDWRAKASVTCILVIHVVCMHGIQYDGAVYITRRDSHVARVTVSCLSPQ